MLVTLHNRSREDLHLRQAVLAVKHCLDWCVCRRATVVQPKNRSSTQSASLPVVLCATMHSHVVSRTLSGVPDHVLELMFEHLRMSDCAACCCVSQELKTLGKVLCPFKLCNGSGEPFAFAYELQQRKSFYSQLDCVCVERPCRLDV